MKEVIGKSEVTGKIVIDKNFIFKKERFANAFNRFSLILVQT